MSVHFLEDQEIVMKSGKPGERKLEKTNQIISGEEIRKLVLDLMNETKTAKDSSMEIDKPYSKVIQSGPYRIVIVLPPLGKKLEVTAVRPVVSLSLDQYELDESLQTYLLENAQGIMITGSPGEGKSTFATAFVNELAKKDVIIKTIESPRDLIVDPSISQYSFSHAPYSEIRDILLLSRPNYSIYDEVRNKEDFLLFKDLRLTGIGLVGVMHANKAIDGVQRMIGTIELGLIPQIVDTLIFIKSGKIAEIYTLEQTVKTPIGMNSDDLSRPVILVKDLLTDEVKYEMYSYGDSVVVMPVEMATTKTKAANNAISKYAKRGLQEYFSTELKCKVAVEIEGGNRVLVYVPDKVKPRFIGKAGVNIQRYEKELGLSIGVREITEYSGAGSQVDSDSAIPYEIQEIKKGKKSMLQIQLSKELAHEEVSCLVGGKLMSFVVNHQGIIQIRRRRLIEEILDGDFSVVA